MDRYIFTVLEANSRGIQKLASRLRAQSILNRQLALGLCAIAAVTGLILYENGKRDSKVAELEKKIKGLTEEE